MVLAAAGYTPYRLDRMLLAASGQAINVDLDLTFVVQLVLFVVLTLILKPVLFDPMLKLFEEREKRIEGARLQARKMDEASAGALTKYDAEMQRARASGNVERDKLRAQGAKEETEILGKVRESTSKTLEEGRSRPAEEAKQVRRALQADSAAIGRQLAARILGSEVEP
jgi:F-type H+-transporting ATPase subunit b